MNNIHLVPGMMVKTKMPLSYVPFFNTGENEVFPAESYATVVHSTHVASDRVLIVPFGSRRVYEVDADSVEPMTKSIYRIVIDLLKGQIYDVFQEHLAYYDLTDNDEERLRTTLEMTIRQYNEIGIDTDSLRQTLLPHVLGELGLNEHSDDEDEMAEYAVQIAFFETAVALTRVEGVSDDSQSE